MKIVDVQSDSEFLDGLDGLHSDYSSDHDRHRLAISSPQSTDLHLRREQPSQSQPPTRATTKPKLRSESREPATIQQVLREMRVQVDESVESVSVVFTEGSGGTKKEGEGGSGSDGGGNVALCSQDGGEPCYFPRQTIALSRVFAKSMEEPGFDGEIMLAEKSSAVELLGSWMSRDLEFEVTVGITQTNAFY